MALYCRLCTHASPDDAFFCISCGAVLQPSAVSTRIRPISSTHPTARIASPSILLFEPPAPIRSAWTWQQVLYWAGVPMVGLVYSIIFLIGIMQVIEYGGIPGLGLWGIAPVVIGALLAEEQWINGRLWSGLFGMVVWAGFPWFLSINLFPFGALLCGAWFALHCALRRP